MIVLGEVSSFECPSCGQHYRADKVNFERNEMKIKFNYSTAGYDTYTKEGFIPPLEHKRPDKWEHRFLNKVDIDQGKIKVQITKLFRLRATDYSTDKREKKEYLMWESNWYAKNWLGEELAMLEHLEGKYRE